MSTIQTRVLFEVFSSLASFFLAPSAEINNRDWRSYHLKILKFVVTVNAFVM
jgi:hypothetical protein